MINKYFDTLYIMMQNNQDEIHIKKPIKQGEKKSIPFGSKNGFGVYSFHEHPYMIEAILKNIIEENHWVEEYMNLFQKKIHLIDTTDNFGEITNIEKYAFFLTLKGFCFLLSSTYQADFQMIMPDETNITEYQLHCLTYYQELFRQRFNNYLVTIFSSLDETSYAVDIHDNNSYTIQKRKC